MFILSSPDSEAAGVYDIPWPAKKIAAQNSYTSLSARNSQKLCNLRSQLAKAAKKMNFKQTYCSLTLFL